MKYQMPRIDMQTLATILTLQELDLVRGIVSTRGESKGRLRASKPPVKYRRVGNRYEPDERQGKIAYIWRMVAFFTSPHPQHHCMPAMADCDIPGSWAEKQATLKELNRIVDAVVDVVSVEEWHGVRRWGQVFGRIGTPQVEPDGSIVYR